MEDEVLKEKEAAEFLRIKYSTLAKMRREGNGPPYYWVGGSVRYLKSTLIEWLKSHNQTKKAV